jgi:hypothetical protein
MNKYEENVVGNYKIYEFKTTNSQEDSLPAKYSLILLEDKKFKFDLGDKIVEGNWCAGDDGDRTWIEFSNENFHQKATVLGMDFEIIEFLNPHHFASKNLKELLLKRDVITPDGADTSTQR